MFQVLADTLSPAWCETLLFDRVLLEGVTEELLQDPPLVIINLYSYQNMVTVTPSFKSVHLTRCFDGVIKACVWVCLQGTPVPLGRAFAEPEFKTVEKHYKKPRLRFFDINMGRVRAGELLATFELIELDYSGFGEVTQIFQVKKLRIGIEEILQFQFLKNIYHCYK